MAPDHYKNIRKEAKDRPRCPYCKPYVSTGRGKPMQPPLLDKDGKCWACGQRAK